MNLKKISSIIGLLSVFPLLLFPIITLVVGQDNSQMVIIKELRNLGIYELLLILLVFFLIFMLIILFLKMLRAYNKENSSSNRTAYLACFLSIILLFFIFALFSFASSSRAELGTGVYVYFLTLIVTIISTIVYVIFPNKES
ncbi:MAG: hypothetical protein H7A23_26850 [Leptospiraceae bacterium]|nr:hypothetical protein [Leptospiraceae bacterium]